MAKRLEQVKPWQVALFMALNGVGFLVFWVLAISPEDAAAGGTIALVAVVAVGILLTFVVLAARKSPPPGDRPTERS
ncbi:hypothetical protein Pan44_03150 [Caulifigura coniformis]|uniref:Uncharacterized protein n=1 Tax=Caulifigura coniformis TaxID=2527983 RepID=A0A517S860_9PLAN|nr:hypothetical protein [Caulifigura coniformis]QDT52306.1 hypothetical protein Pan44_03150 [Caulifigura coniformis]